MPPNLLPEVLEKEARKYLEAFPADRLQIRIEAPVLTTPQPWRAIVQAATRLQSCSGTLPRDPEIARLGSGAAVEAWGWNLCQFDAFESR
jgi:hypothetical protein